jgi:hypothetical protein
LEKLKLVNQELRFDELEDENDYDNDDSMNDDDIDLDPEADFIEEDDDTAGSDK